MANVRPVIHASDSIAEQEVEFVYVIAPTNGLKTNRLMYYCKR